MQPYEVLEKSWAKWNNLDPAGMVVCSSGTAALHLAFEALQLPLGSEVICPDVTMIACPRAISLAGLTPVFVDCRNDLLIDPSLMSDALSKKTKASMAVHIYGHRCDVVKIYRRYGGHYIIEDLAEAHGVRPHPQTDAACWSFFKNKIVSGEEGGAVYFKQREHADLARQLRCLGFTDAHNFVHTARGHNYRMSNVHARLILDSLAAASRNVEARRTIEALYDRWCPLEWRMPARQAVWVYDIRIPGLTCSRQADVVYALNIQDIAARMSFWPMHLQPEYQHCRVVGNGNAERLANEVFYLPVQPGVTTEADARRAFEVIREALP